MASSQTVDMLLDLVGRGRIDITCATDVARAVLGDGLEHPTVKKLASLGNFGVSQANCERDLHRNLKTLFGLCVEPYALKIELQAHAQSQFRFMSK